MMMAPEPDVRYQWNLEVLGLIGPMLAEAFNKEYETGDKNLDDYLKSTLDYFGKI